MDFTILCGVDAKHLNQLRITYPTWIRHKPRFLDYKMLVFYDREEVKLHEIRQAISHPRLELHEWPPEEGVVFEGDSSEKWTHPQRYKMLAGFVHASKWITTPYYLKLDCDTIATGMEHWIDSKWFIYDFDLPVIVSHPWGFTRPAGQLLLYDQWVKECERRLPEFANTLPLNLKPIKPESERVRHRRIISWCAFFDTKFTQTCSSMAERTCGKYKLPFPSQDTFLWYCSVRMNRKVVRVSMKKRGWEVWQGMKRIEEAITRAMQG